MATEAPLNIVAAASAALANSPLSSASAALTAPPKDISSKGILGLADYLINQLVPTFGANVVVYVACLVAGYVVFAKLRRGQEKVMRQLVARLRNLCVIAKLRREVVQQALLTTSLGTPVTPTNFFIATASLILEVRSSVNRDQRANINIATARTAARLDRLHWKFSALSQKATFAGCALASFGVVALASISANAGSVGPQAVGLLWVLACALALAPAAFLWLFGVTWESEEVDLDRLDEQFTAWKRGDGAVDSAFADLREETVNATASI